MSDCTTISMYNAKGGVGKTTTSVNVAAALSRKGLKVLAVDLDGQANLTMAFGIEVPDDQSTIYDALVGNAPLPILTSQSGVDVVPSDACMYQLESELSSCPDRGMILSRLLDTVRTRYDYIFLDCPPAFSLVSISAIIGSDYIFLVSNMSGLTKRTTDGIRELISRSFEINGTRKILGLIFTMNRYTLENRQVVESVRQSSYRALPFNQTIRMSTYISEAAAMGEDIFSYYPDCPAAKDYENLADEMLNRINYYSRKK